MKFRHFLRRLHKEQRNGTAKFYSDWWLLLILWLAGVIPEVVVHLATAYNPTTRMSSGLLLGPLFAIVPAMIVFSILCLIPKRKINIAISIIYAALYGFVCAAQLVYYSIFGVFFSAYSMVNGGAAAQFWRVAVEHCWINAHWILLIFLPTIFLAVIAWRLFAMKGLRSWKISLVPVVAAIAVQMLLIVSLPFFGGKESLSAYDLYYNTADAYYGINKLGLLTGFRLDLTRYFTGNEPDGALDLEATMPSFTWQPQTTVPTIPMLPTTTPGSIPNGTIPTDPMPTEPIPTEPPIDTSPNILDIDFETLIAEEDDKTIRQIHQYFAGRNASNKNEYTGIFEGCNLIMITAEGFSASIIDPERTPTLYKMMSEGIYLDNYYVPSWGVSTTDGEYVFLTGTIPKANVWSFKVSANNAMPLTMSKQLIRQGYHAFAYHGHTYTYYSRHKYLANLGFQYKGVGNGLHINSRIWPESDYEVVDQTTAEYVGSEPFVTYYMSISGHLEYTFNDNMMASKNKGLVKNEPFSSNVRAYIACQLEFEKSLALLLERLEEAGVLENTVIVITADHYPYGLTDEEYSELMGQNVTKSDLDIYKNGCLIYKAGMEGQVVTRLASHLDLLPTLSNLFGLEFDSRLYMGRDIFSDAMGLVVFQDRSWITDIASYNASTKKYTYFTDVDIPDGYIDYIKSEVSNRFTISKRILEHDYWSILFPEDE